MKKYHFQQNEDFKASLVALVMFTAIILAVVFICLYIQEITDNKIQAHEEKFNIQIVELENKINEKLETVIIQSLEIAEEEIVEDDRFIVYDIPLDEDLQRYVYEESMKYDIPDTLVYAIMYVESRFDFDAESHTNDSGITQVNRKTAKWIADELGYETYDLHDPKVSVEFSLWYLNHLKERFAKLDMSEDDRAYYTISAYNRGYQGSINYIAKHGFNVKYTDLVFDYKYKLESGELDRQVQ